MSLNLPDGVSEADFVEIVDRIANSLCDKFKFGYYDREDIKQECYIKAIDALDRYDPGNKPLANFLWTHVHNRLCNLKRDKYFRLTKPCDDCPLKAYLPETDTCTAYDNKTDCKPYSIWFTKNSSKQNIMNPIGIGIINDEQEEGMRESSNIVLDVAHNEIFNIIDSNISITMRKYWLQQKGGIKINKKNYDLLIEEIFSILKDNNIDVSQTW